MMSMSGNLLTARTNPLELKNVYNDPKYAEIVIKLKKELVEIRKKYGDSEELSQRIQDRYMQAIEK